MFKDFDDDVAWSAGLMRCLDEVAQATIRSWWERNLILKGRRLRDAEESVSAHRLTSELDACF